MQGCLFPRCLFPGQRPSRPRAPRLVLAAFGIALIIALGNARAEEAPVPGQHPAFAACLAFDRAACANVLADQPGNLTARFLRGLAAEMGGDARAAFADFDQVVVSEPRHFGAQLWRYVTASSRADAAEVLRAYLDAAGLGPWPSVLGRHYLDEVPATALIDLAAAQPASTRAEALCAAHYHAGRKALMAGDRAAVRSQFAAALATGASHVFEYQAAERALRDLP